MQALPLASGQGGSRNMTAWRTGQPEPPDSNALLRSFRRPLRSCVALRGKKLHAAHPHAASCGLQTYSWVSVDLLI